MSWQTPASPLALGWVGAICVAAALSLVALTSRRARCLSPGGALMNLAE